MLKWFFLGITLLTHNLIIGQTENINFFKQKYSENDYIILNKSVVLEIKLKKGKISIKEKTAQEDLFLTTAAKNYAKESISYSNFYKLENIEASSFSIEKNGKYKEHKITEFKKKDDLTSSFHDDIKLINFIYPNLELGSKTSLKTEINILNPRFFTPVYFGGSVPYLTSTLTVIVDNNIKVDFKKFHLDKLKVNFNTINKKNKTIYKWEVKNVLPIKLRSNSPSYNNYYPHIIPLIKEYKIDKQKNVKVSESVESLYNWYYSLVKNVKGSTYSEELISTVKDLLKDKKTEIEKVKAIYYWVQKNIKYVAFEYDLGGFIPRLPNKVYSNKYGDCKDNSMLLYAMMDIAGIQSSLTWIGTRKIPYTYKDLPTPLVDNHMILAYENNNQTYYLDATGRYQPLEIPTSFIQGKEALISFGEGSFKIKKIPIIDAKLNKQTDSITFTIEKNNIVGSGVKSYTGYSKINNFFNIENIKTDGQKLNYYRRELTKGNNKFELLSYTDTNKFNYELPYKVLYNFKIPNYISTYEDEIYLNMNLIPFFKYSLIDEKRECDFEVDYQSSYEYKYEFKIPKGYNVEYLPKNISILNDLFSAKIQYKIQGETILYTHSVELNYLVLEKKDFHVVISEVKKIKKEYKELVVLKRK